jgi:hypothetical protein
MKTHLTEEEARHSKLTVDPLKYRGVFDYPQNQSANLLGASGTGSSLHVTRFMGWTGRGSSTRYSGEPSTASILDQKAAWMSEWLQKGQYAGSRQQ